MFDNYGNLIIIKGGTLEATVTYYEPDGITPIDLTDKEAITRVKENINSPDGDALVLSTANGGMILGGITGTITWYMHKDDTADITLNEGIFDTFLIDNDVEVPFIFHNKFYAPERV